MNIEEY